MSYTLRGRLESRAATLALPVLAAAVLAAALADWWPLELAGVMVAVTVVLDGAVYHRLLPYQPGWLALPLGAAELGLTMALVIGLGIDAPLPAALAFFGGSWLLAQVLGHALFPLARLTYGEDGGELGRLGPALAVAVLVVFAGAGGVAWGMRPPTVHLAAGVHQGPLVLTSAQHLVGEPGAVVRGGIVVRADDVTIDGVTVLGGEDGIKIDGARNVTLDHVRVSGAVLDGIHVRRSVVRIRDCIVQGMRSKYAQGIDISFTMDLPPSSVEGCVVHGGQEGIVSHSANVDLSENQVSGTTLRGITVTEMSMGMVDRNVVSNALGVGIFCGDHSECEIERNAVTGTQPDLASGDKTRGGVAIEAHFGAHATLADNSLEANADPSAAYLDATIRHDPEG